MLWSYRFYILILSFIITAIGCKKRSTSPTEYIEQLQQLHQRLEHGSPDSASVWLQQINVIQEQFQVPDSLVARTAYHKGLYYFELGQLDTAAQLFHRAISLVDTPLVRETVNYFRMAWMTYSAQEKFGECLAISNDLESLLDSMASPVQKSLLYFIREKAYRQQQDYKRAIENNQYHIEQLQLARDTQELASALISKAFYTYFIQRNTDSTFAILDMLVGREKLHSANDNRVIFGDYGVYLFYEGRYQEALLYYKKGLQIVHQMKDQPGKNGYLGTFYSNIAEAYMELGDYQRAQIYLDSVKWLGLNNLTETTRNSALRYQLQLLYKEHQGLDPIMDALDSILWYQNQQFKLKNEKELEALKLVNEKEKELLAISQNEKLKNLRLQSRQILLLFVLIVTLSVGYLLYRQRRLNFEKQKLQLHQRLLRSQMNPHFTYNILYTIQNLIKKDPEKAISYQLKFSRLLRLVLENSTTNYVQLDKELTAVEKYMELQLLRFPGKFQYEFLMDGILRDDFIFIPPMLLQPIVENCIEHGFAGIHYTGHIQVRLSLQKAQYLSCVIEDNGLGLQAREKEDKQSSSGGLIDAFLKKLTPSGLKITDKKGNGLIVEFLIPYKKTAND